MKTFIFSLLLLGIMQTAFAENREVQIEYHRNVNTKKDKVVNRAPQRIPIKIVYDTEAYKIIVKGNEELKAEIFLYNDSGTLECHSTVLNTTFMISNTSSYIILIKGDNWHAEGIIEN